MDAATGKDLFVIPPFALSRLVYSPDGTTLAAAYGNMFERGDIRLWDVGLGKEVHRFPGQGTWHALQFHADGKSLAGADLQSNCVTVWDVASGAEIRTWNDVFNPKKEFMPAAAFSPDLALLAVGHDNGTISIGDAAKRETKRTLAGHTARIHMLKFTSDGTTLVSSGHDGTIRLWSLDALRARQVIPLGPANAALTFDLDPSGKYLIAAGNSPVIYVLRLPPGKDQAAPWKTEPTTGVTPPTHKNNLGMEFILVGKGKFRMGGGAGNPGDKEVEIAHDFYIGKYEVTQEEWHKVTMANPSYWSREGAGNAAVKKIPEDELKRFPVENVSWDDTQLFLEALNARDKEAGWVYRLPTEAEWEYACRGGPSSNKFDYAFDFYFETPANKLLPGQANYVDGGPERPCAVGSFKPNQLGLYDMHGNVWEWCDDIEKAADGAPRRTARGGGFGDGADWCRAAFRHPLYPPSQRPGGHFGLRVVRVPVGKANP
jgi:formylglycine-generating enzyme required for sulfatase activity